jgi:hypothetical protein
MNVLVFDTHEFQIVELLLLSDAMKFGAYHNRYLSNDVPDLKQADNFSNTML